KYQLNEIQLRQIFRYSGGIPFHIRFYEKWISGESTIEEYSKSIAAKYSREIFEFFRDLNRDAYLFIVFALDQELIGGEISLKNFFKTYPLLNELLPKSQLTNVLVALKEYGNLFSVESDEENFSIKMQAEVLLFHEAIKNLPWIRVWAEMLKFSKVSSMENAEKAVSAYGELIGFKLESDDLTKKVSEQFREFYIARINADGRETLGMRLETFIVIPFKPWKTGKSSPEFLQFYISLQEEFRIHLKSIHEGASIPKFYLIFAEFHGGKKEFIKNELKDLERVPILDATMMKGIILSPSPLAASKDYIFKQLNISERSPYITAGAVQDLFYGRNLEIALIRGLPENIGIFGTRTIGKTSLLLKLYREIKMNTNWKPYVIDCARIDSEESLLKNLAQKMQIDFSSISDIEKFREYILREAENHNAQYLFLLDEVDRLVKYDADHGQRIFNTFNQMCTESLASGGKAARFLLCGFYEMYKQMSDHESRLYNFMVFLPLKPLDKKSALTLVTKPMQDIYVHWENETDAHYLVERCSGHPLLLQTACQALLSTLDRKISSKDTIEKKDVDEALMAQEFRNICLRFYRPTSDEEVKKKKAWIKHRETTDMRQSLLEHIHRIILLSTAISRSKEKKESFTLAAIQADLKKYGITISPEDLRNTLDYLCLCGVFRLQNEPTLLTTHVDKVREAMADELSKTKQENLHTFEITGIEEPDFYSHINGTFLSFSYEFAVQIFPDLLVADLGGLDKCEEELKNLIKLKNKEKKVGDNQTPGGFKNEPGIFKPSIE
ncbi:MAG: hypothetical protein QG657_1, partial [Acidobacteriota bacterium]|nr:hypothetical protein [Acidobacteriota bacterium]